MTHPTQKNSWYYFALIISYLLHPVFIPTYIFTVFYYCGNMVFNPYSILAQLYIVAMILVTTAIIPLIVLGINLLLLGKKIGNRELLMDSSKDRIVPFFYAGIYYCALTYMFSTYIPHFPLLLTCLMMIISISVLMTAFISIFWKISAHAIALGASLMIFILMYTIIPNPDFIYVIIVTLLISGITLSSRLYLNGHTPAQVYAGYALGILISSIGLYFLVFNLFDFSFNL